jgi:hypothetical protein
MSVQYQSHQDIMYNTAAEHPFLHATCLFSQFPEV